MKRPLVAFLAFLFSPCYPLTAAGQSASDSSLYAARLVGEWTFELRVTAQNCSPPHMEGASTRTTVTIAASPGSVWRRRGLAGSTKLTWDWLARATSRGPGRFDIAWINDSVVFTIDHVWTHDGGMYGWGRWQGDSIVGTWEQAGYCPTPSGSFVLRRAGGGREWYGVSHSSPPATTRMKRDGAWPASLRSKRNSNGSFGKGEIG